MEKVMAAHQPNFLPYLGFFDKMERADVFVIRDDCQFTKRDFHNRNKIRSNTQEGFSWLAIPVDDAPIPLGDVAIQHDKKVNGKEPWTSYHLRMIEQFYKKSPHFADFFPGLAQIYADPGDNLADFNERIIGYLAHSFGIKTPLVRFSQLPPEARGQSASETLVNATLASGASRYISGDGGHGYLDTSAFEGKVQLAFQEYRHPTYEQAIMGKPVPFMPYMASIDALFNVGELPRGGN